MISFISISHFINRRSELNKTLQTLSEVIIVHPVLVYNYCYYLGESMEFCIPEEICIQITPNLSCIRMNGLVPLLQKSGLGSMDGHYKGVDFPVCKTKFLKIRAPGE